MCPRPPGCREGLSAPGVVISGTVDEGVKSARRVGARPTPPPVHPSSRQPCEGSPRVAPGWGRVQGHQEPLAFFVTHMRSKCVAQQKHCPGAQKSRSRARDGPRARQVQVGL